MLPLFTGDFPLFVHANDYRQIEQAVQFSQQQGVRMILVGGKESWKLTQLLIENDIPVIYGDVHSMPMRPDDPYDNTFHIPSQLAEAGIEFCIGVFQSWGTRNLPFQAGQAAAFGLSKSMALRSVTLSTAEILGLAEELGSLEVGKRATVVVSEGDIMDHLTHQVVLMFIDGRKVDLDNKHKELYRKYRSRNAAR
jgi:imidazolonepropionase-like amidohydrolase